MTALETLGFISCLWAICFVAAFGFFTGAWAAIKAASWAFGPLNVNLAPISVRVSER